MQSVKAEPQEADSTDLPTEPCLPKSVLTAGHIRAIGRAMLRELKINLRNLPVRLRVPTLISIHEWCFGPGVLMIVDTKEVLAMFGEWAERKFRGGDYATVCAVVLSYNVGTEETAVDLYYRVYNKEHVIQWPLDFEPRSLLDLAATSAGCGKGVKRQRTQK